MPTDLAAQSQVSARMAWPRITLKPHSKDFGAPLGSVNPSNPIAYLDLALDGEPAGRVRPAIRSAPASQAGPHALSERSFTPSASHRVSLLQLVIEVKADLVEEATNFVASLAGLTGLKILRDDERKMTTQPIPGGATAAGATSPFTPWARGAVAVSAADAGPQQLELFLGTAEKVEVGKSLVIGQVIRGYRALNLVQVTCSLQLPIAADRNHYPTLTQRCGSPCWTTRRGSRRS